MRSGGSGLKERRIEKELRILLWIWAFWAKNLRASSREKASSTSKWMRSESRVFKGSDRLRAIRKMGGDGFQLGGGQEELGFRCEGVEAENGNSGDRDAILGASEAGIGEGEASNCELKLGGENVSGSVGLRSGAEDRGGDEVKSGEGETKWVVWYKLPFEILKICALRLSPVWSLSVAAAVVGLVILKRRLSKTAQKSWRILLEISVDDKVSQTMVCVARLNEAFSVVKRVPIIRFSLSGTGGIAPWPVVGLR